MNNTEKTMDKIVALCKNSGLGVIGSGSGGGGDGELAELIGDLVVGGDVSLCLLVLDGADFNAVVGAADLGLRAGELQLNIVAVYLTFNGGDGPVGEGLAVIHLGLVAGGDGERTLGDFQAALFYLDVELGGNILAGGVLDGNVGKGDVTLARVRSGAGGEGGGNGVAGGECGGDLDVRGGEGQGGAVIDLGGAGGNGDVGDSLAGDFQGAFLQGESVIGGHVLAAGVADLYEDFPGGVRNRA